jgi:hypothetical protein
LSGPLCAPASVEEDIDNPRVRRGNAELMLSLTTRH